MMLDVDGDGLITLQEMLEAIKEAFAARKSLRPGCFRAHGHEQFLRNEMVFQYHVVNAQPSPGRGASGAS